MKVRRLLTTAFITTLAFMACNNDEQIESSSDNEIKIITSIGNLDGNQTKAIMDADGKGSFENGDVIYLCWMNNVGSGSAINYEIGVDKIYWDQYSTFLEPPVTFMACYQKGKVPNFIGRLVYFNAATEQEKDILLAIPDTVEAKKPVNLKFFHAMHKLNVNLTSNVFTNDDLEYAEVSLKNLKSTALVLLAYGQVAIPSSEGNDPYDSKTGANTSFIVAPQELTAGSDFIEINISNITYIYKVPANLDILDSGKILTLNLSINRSTVSLENSSISGWETQDTIDDNAEMQ
jgi:hypothetical protein